MNQGCAMGSFVPCSMLWDIWPVCVASLYGVQRTALVPRHDTCSSPFLTMAFRTPSNGYLRDRTAALRVYKCGTVGQFHIRHVVCELKETFSHFTFLVLGCDGAVYR